MQDDLLLGMSTILGMVAVLGMELFLRKVNVLVMVRPARWTPWFNELYLMFISKVWDRQTDRKTDRQKNRQTGNTVYRVCSATNNFV